MADVVSTTTVHRAYSVGPLKVQRLQCSIPTGTTSCTATAVNLSTILTIFSPGVKKTAAPTYSGNVATLSAFTVPAETAASGTIGGVTYTAVAGQGAGGNSITVAYTSGGTAGAEVVTVSGLAISVQIQSGVSTITQVRTAVNAAGAATALVTATGTSATTVATTTATALTSGVNGGCTSDMYAIGY